MEKSVKDFEKEVRELSDAELDVVAGGFTLKCPLHQMADIKRGLCLTKEEWAERYGQESADAVFTG